MKRILLVAAFLSLFASCKRDIAYDTVSVTEPSLTVIVETKTGIGSAITYAKVNGAEVKLYNNQADFDNDTTPFRSKTTDQDGKAVFSKSDLVTKGVFYVRAISDTLSGTATTPYMLLNDGETYLHIELK